MKQSIKIILIALITAIVVVLFVLNTPAHWYSFVKETPKFGSFSYTSLTGGETLSNFPTLWNTTFSNVSANLFSLADWYATTSAPQLATLGTITTGTWHGSTLTVPYGGTGSTTLSSNQLLLGNGTGNIGIVSGWGTTGQLLTSNGAGSAPTWQSASFDTTQNYNFTGVNLFKNFNASSTVANPITLNGLTFSTPASRSASSTILAENGSGSLSFNTLQALGGSQFLDATTTDLTITNTTFENIYATSSSRILVGGQFTTNNRLNVKLYLTALTGQGGSSQLTFKLKLGGTTVCTLQTQSDVVASNVVPIIVDFSMNATSTTAEACRGTMNGQTTVTDVYNESFAAVDLSTTQAISVTAQWNGASGSNSVTIGGAEFMKY